MPLEEEQSRWLYLFTAGAVKLPKAITDKAGPAATLADDLRVARAREFNEEQSLKAVLLTRSFKAIDAQKEEIREALDLKIKVKANPNDQAPDAVDETGQKIAKKSKRKVQDLRDARGRQERAFEADEAGTMSEVPKGLSTTREMGAVPEKGKKDGSAELKKETKLSANNAFKLVVDESDKLAMVMTKRSFIDEKAARIAQRSERLFTDDEIMDELYTPLVREVVLPETIIPPKFSATQKMIEGSNDYYLKECKSKGKKVGTGVADLAKGAVTLGAAVATTVVASLAPVATGQDAMNHSGTISKAAAARATDITNGIAAALTGTIDAIDQIDDLRNSGDFSVSGYNSVMNACAVSIGRIVAGATGNENLGLAVTDGMTAAIKTSSVVPIIVNYGIKGGQPPIGDLISAVGGVLSSTLATASDQTSGTPSTSLAKTSEGVTALYSTIAASYDKKLIAACRKGDWDTVFSVLSTAATKASAGLPLMLKYADQYDAIPEDDRDAQYVSQAALLKAMADTESAIDGAGDAGADLASEAMAALAKKFKITLPPTPSAAAQAEIDKKFDARQKALEEAKAEELRKDLASIETTLAKEQTDYQASLKCLGSPNPEETEFKSIAKLVEQLERDRMIWDGLNALFGTGLGAASGITASISAIASEVAAPLKIAGQLLKYIANLKAAADRLDAWLTWRDGQKDARNAVSPYGTSIDNFVKNQGQQFSHYTLQAASNAIQALLAAGEMSPYAPAFKIAGASVAAAAAAEDVAYKFYKHVALKRAWSNTKEAFDPKNKGNRKMALLVRRVNPTLAKYTLAYGALIEESPIAITAMNRIGIDRETLTRAGDGVAELKGYLEKLYPDDGTAIGVMPSTARATKVPEPVLTSKAWALSHLLWTEKDRLATPNPPSIVANLALAEVLLAKKAAAKTPQDFTEDDYDNLLGLFPKLENAFLSFDPRTASSAPLTAAKDTAEAYADLVWATGKAVRMDYDARPATP